MRTFGDALKKMRKERGWTQQTFLEALAANGGPNMSIYAIRNWEQGRAIPENSTIEALCDLFHCDRDALFGTLDCSTHNLQYVCETTGLSEKAINNLTAYGRLAKPFSTLLESVEFSRIIADISLYIQNSLITVEESIVADSMWIYHTGELEKLGFVVTDPKTNARYHYENAIEQLKKLLDQTCEQKNAQITVQIKKLFRCLDNQDSDALYSTFESIITELGMSRKNAAAELCRRIDAIAAENKDFQAFERANTLKKRLRSYNEVVLRANRESRSAEKADIQGKV